MNTFVEQKYRNDCQMLTSYMGSWKKCQEYIEKIYLGAVH